MSTIQERINTAYKAAAERILPARLVNDAGNLLAVAAVVKAKGLDPEQPETWIAAFQAVLHSLNWAVKPKKLVLEESANAPAKVENQRQIEEARQATAKAQEQKEKVKKEFDALVAQCESLIAGYAPTKKSGHPDYPEKEASQAKWKATLADAVKKNNLPYMRSYRDSLVKTIDKRYQEIERAKERL